MIDAYSDFFVQTCKSSIKKLQLHFHSIVCFSRRWRDQIPNKCVYDDIGWSPLNAAWATVSIMYGGSWWLQGSYNVSLIYSFNFCMSKIQIYQVKVLHTVFIKCLDDIICMFFFPEYKSVYNGLKIQIIFIFFLPYIYNKYNIMVGWRIAITYILLFQP